MSNVDHLLEGEELAKNESSSDEKEEEGEELELLTKNESQVEENEVEEATEEKPEIEESDCELLIP